MELDELGEIIRQREIYAFVGSGPSLYIRWAPLIVKLCSGCGVGLSADQQKRISDGDADLMLDLADQCRAADEPEYSRQLAVEFGKILNSQPAIYSHLSGLPFRAYVTTIFDPSLRRHLIASGRVKPENVFYYPGQLPPIAEAAIYHVHGLVQENCASIDPDSVILGAKQFAYAYSDPHPVGPPHALRIFLGNLFLNDSCCFVGCGIAEPEIRAVLRYCESSRGSFKLRPPRGHHYALMSMISRVDPSKGTMVRDLLEEGRIERSLSQCGVTVVWYDRKDRDHSGLREVFDKWREIPDIRP